MSEHDDEAWRRPPLASGRLLDGAFRLAGSTALALWPLWVADLVTNALGAAWVRANLGPDFALSPEQVLLYAVVMSIPGTVILGVAVRAMLGVGRARWRLDRGLVGYGLIGLAMLLSELLPASLMVQAADGIADPYWRQWACTCPARSCGSRCSTRPAG